MNMIKNINLYVMLKQHHMHNAAYAKLRLIEGAIYAKQRQHVQKNPTIGAGDSRRG